MAVLHGIGGNFCAGYDLEALAGLDDSQVKILTGLLISNILGLSAKTVSTCLES